MVCEQIKQCRVIYSLMGFIIDLFINIFHLTQSMGGILISLHTRGFFFFFVSVSNLAPHDSAR